MQTLVDIRHRLRRELLSPERYVDAALEVRLSTGETLLTVGGVWDCVDQRFVEGRAARPHVVTLMPSQATIGHALKRYVEQRLAGDDARNLILFAGGNRGGGKTWIGALAMVVLALALPGCWQTCVCIKTSHKREVLDAIQQIAAPKWIASDVADFRDPHTNFLTGATVMWMSSKNPAALRQAGLPFELVFLNEGQDLPPRVFSNAVYAIRKTGGLVAIASNPPQVEAGDWTATLLEAIEANAVAGEYHELPAAENTSIHQATIPKIANALRAVDLAAFEADAMGLFKLSGDLAYPGFSSAPRKADGTGGHVGDPPDLGWTDVTRQLTAEAVSGSVGFDFVGGSDFQRTPGTCAVVGKLYRDTAGNVVLWIREPVATRGVEEDLSQALVSRGYYPGPVDLDGHAAPSLLLVGDATGAKQNAEHRNRDPYSFTRLRADGWNVIPPQWHWKTRAPWNPLVRDSRAQLHALFSSRQILISPRCSDASEGFPSLIDSFRRAKVHVDGGFVRKGHLTHLPDCVRYLAWRFLPRPQQPKADPGTFDHDTFNAIASIDFRSSFRGGR